MKKTYFFIFFLILIISSISVFAKTNYTQIGGENVYYDTGTGFFNSELSDNCGTGDLSCTTRNINTPLFVPLVVDLDIDGTNEIIVFDGTNIRLYQGSSLTIVDAFILSGTPKAVLTYDIDGDNLSEIIIYEDYAIEIVEYNGTEIYQQTTFPILLEAETPFYVQCKGTNDCVAIGIDETGADDLDVTAFNSSGVFTAINGTTIFTSVGGICFEKNNIKSVAVADTDNNGTLEYIFSTAEYGNPTSYVHIHWISVNETDVISEHESSDEIFSLSNGNCGNLVGLYTSPVVFDIDGSSSNGLEAVIGLMVTDDDFKMYSYTSTGVFLDDYPEVANGEGIIVSNVFRANVFSDTASEDFCVLGYQGALLRNLNLICGSEQTGAVPETLDFTFDSPVNFNVSSGYHLITHSGQHSTITTDGNNLDEIINSYGVWKLDFVLFDELELIWENEKGDSVLIPVDVQKSGREDLLVLTDTNLWYINDGFETSPSNISEYTIDPCIDATWKINSSVGVTITPTDVDGDLVGARSILYLGDSNEQDSGWSVNGSSGTTFSFSHVANKTIGSSTLRLMSRDSSNPATGKVIDLTFSVGTSGVEFGDCETNFNPLDVDEDDAISEDNAITNSMDAINDVANLGLDRVTIWLIVMIVAGFIIWISPETLELNNPDPTTTFGAMLIVEILLMLLGFKLGFIGAGTIFVVVIVALGYIAFKNRDLVMGK